jgi:tetratricopeptide (TPR) repeat protein
MPAHVYMRVGRYADASAASERAIAADQRYQAEVTAAKAYRVGYAAHNDHFLWAAAAMEGRSAVALAAARAAYSTACGSGPVDRENALVQHYAVLPLFALVRFGRWREILTETLPPDIAQPYPLAIWHYARGTAHLRMGDVAKARAELRALQQEAGAPALAAVKIKNLNAAAQLVRIASLTLEGDLALAEGRADAALASLRAATAIEDGLQYDEPHLWLAPTRHALGAALLASHEPGDAEAVFRADLAHYPENGWSLLGLAQALRAQGRTAEARAVEARFAKAWERADATLSGARF